MKIKKGEFSNSYTKGPENLKGENPAMTINATGTKFGVDGGLQNLKLDKSKSTHKEILNARWKKGDKASGGTLNELVAARKGHKKGSAEYAEIQNKINSSLGSKKVHKGTKVNKKGETVETKPKGTTTRKADGATVEKGLGAQKGKTLTFTEKEAEGVKISKANKTIKEGKSDKDKNKRDAGQLEKGLIRAGRDNAKTGTMLSRALARRKVKRNKRQLKNRNAGKETNGTTSGS
eukprot:GHVO01062346.1.p1 GENE.GHVO01062346.1~~GHVO01062346.1.p1  ORF type:complete len:268 (+),score=-9.98 GHVO01062346.1:105-806(+)